jgi:glycosyltransferase involved in cell wall biosynthesis
MARRAMALNSITFLTQRFDITVGAVYTISELARHLAPHIRVSLVVQSGEPDTIDGVQTYVSADLDPRQMPDADVIVSTSGFMDHDRLFGLPPSKGKRAIYLQGWHGERTLRNLRRADAVLAVSRWLVDEAARDSVRARFVRYGFDYDIFHSDPSQRTHRPLVSMGTDKALDVGLGALTAVRQRHPDVDFTLFGRAIPPDATIPFLLRPDRRAVGDLWRRTTVAVCSSALEGFGFPGLEAIACGAALATTDTRGSREYAFHDVTALVSPPGDAQALAQNIERLVADQHLRERLVAAGQLHLTRTYTRWPDASVAFAAALAEELQAGPAYEGR